MPINFETTFVQPVLAELDAGKITNASDWARVITKYYVATIKTGAPQGVPFTLPAPAFLGAPYPMGNIFYNTIDAKSRLMENIIKAYFLTEEIKIQKGGIKGLAQTVKQLVLKARVLKSQIKSLTQQIKQVIKELEELPTTLTELYQNITEEITSKKEELRLLVGAIDNFQLESNSIDVRSYFSNELSLIEDITNFEFSFNLSTLQKFTSLTSGLDTRLTQIEAVTSSNQAFRAYILQTITRIARDLFELINTAVSPTQYITFYQQLSDTNSRARIIYEKLKRIEYFEKKLEPKLQDLQKKIKVKTDQLANRVETRIDELKKDIKKRGEELAQRKGDGKATIYKNAKKTLSDFKQKYKEQLKKNRENIKRYTKIIKLVNKVTNKSISIVLGVNAEIQKIKQLQSNLQIDTEQNKLLIQEFANKNGLSEIANTLTLLVVDSKIDAQIIIEQLKTRTAIGAQYYNQLITLYNNDIPDLLAEINKTPRQQKAIAEERETSFLTFYKFYESRVQPELNKIKDLLKRKVDETKKTIDEQIDTTKNDISEFAINLIPVKSDVEDKKTKKLTVEEKRRLLEDKKKKLTKIKKQIACSKQLLQGSTVLLKNIVSGEYSYSRNEVAINKIADGYFNFKSIDKSGSEIEALLEKKQTFKRRSQDLLLVDNLILAIKTLVNEIKSDPEFSQKWKDRVLDKIEDNTKITLFKSVGNILSGSTSNPKDIASIGNELTYAALQDYNTIRNIATIEQRYTQKTLQLISRFAQSKTQAGLYFKDLENKLQGEKSIVVFLLNQITIKQQGVINYLNAFVENAKLEIANKINEKKTKIEEQNKAALDALKEKKLNVKAGIMSLTFSVATRALWSGGTWVGPTGTIFTVASIGPFKPIKAQIEGGASAMIREIARGFETQLKILTGTYANPTAGITPIPFVGYR